MILQESDMFMDALTAASTKNKEPRKRKRRTSISKDAGPEVKKLDTSSENNRDQSPPLTSPPSSSSFQKIDDKALLKPNFKFYQDTLEIEDDETTTTTTTTITKGKKSDAIKMQKGENGEEDADEERGGGDDDEDEDDDDEEYDDEEHKISKSCKDMNQDNEDNNDEEERSTTPTPTAEDSFTTITDNNKAIIESNQEESNEIRYVDGLRSVLIIQKRKGPKKSLKWKVELESVRYFELDETERVNVTKTFTDMKQIDKQNEREAFQMARKLSNEDLMEEKTRWRALIPIDVPQALVEPGKDSREKDIQYAREKGILQALYFHRNMIPDSPAEPEEERLLTAVVMEAKVIPLDDLTGTKANEKDFTTTPWPEPKPQHPNPPIIMTQQQHHPSVTSFPYQPYSQNNPMIPSMGPPPPQQQQQQQQQQTPMGPIMPIMNPMNQMGTEMGVPTGGGGGWRTGDGKVVVPDMPGIPPPLPPHGYSQNMEGPIIPPPPGMMGPPMYNQQDGFMLGPDDMGYNNVPNNFQGGPAIMFGPGPNFQGGPRNSGPMHVNRGGRGGPPPPPPGAGWFRGGGGGGPPVRGVGGGGWRGGWRGNTKQPPVCRQFSKSGYCRAENKCQFLHPGVNCPPF